MNEVKKKLLTELINKNRDIIKDKNWTKLYELASEGEIEPELTALLYSRGINPILDKNHDGEYLYYLPPFFAYGLDNVPQLSTIDNRLFNNSIYEIRKFAFSNCKSVEQVDYSGEIHNSAFENCENLKSVKLGTSKSSNTSSNYRIYNNSFIGCSNLETVHIGKFVAAIGDNCFKGCINLKNVTIDDDAKLYIKSEVFKYCFNLTQITLPRDSTIASDSFRGSNIEAINFLSENDFNHWLQKNYYVYRNYIKNKIKILINGEELKFDED